MKPDRLPDCLDHMLEAATLACSYVQDMDRESFAQDKKTQQDGHPESDPDRREATKVLRDHEAFAQAHVHMPWRAMKDMRNRIAHGYFEINLDVVWETVQTALPALQEQLRALAPPAGAEPAMQSIERTCHAPSTRNA